MQIVELYAENFKRLVAVHLKPGNTLLVTGENGQGKSSLLDSIWATLGGKEASPADPVRHGAEHARVMLDLGELVAERRWKGDGDSELILRAKDGSKVTSPQGVLDSFIGRLCFDPLEFSRMKPKDQRAALLRAFGLDKPVAEIDKERTAAFEERTRCNRLMEELQAIVGGIPDHGDVKPVSVAELTATITASQQAAGERDRLLRAAEEADRDGKRAENAIVDVERRVAELNRERERLVAEKAAANQRRGELQGQAAAIQVPDRGAVEKQLADAQETNRKAEAMATRKFTLERIGVGRGRIESLTSTIAGCDQRKDALLAGAKSPVAGLSVSTEGVLVHGVPFEQASASERLRTSVAVAMALNPQLRILLVRDASLLDEASMAAMQTMATEGGYQLFIERVGKGDVGVHIREGLVAEIDGQPAPPPPTTAPSMTTPPLARGRVPVAGVDGKRADTPF